MRRCFFVFIFSSSIILVIAAAGYAVQNNGSAGAQTPVAGNVPALHAGPPAAAPRLGRPKPFADITQNASIVSTAEEIVSKGCIKRTEILNAKGKYPLLRRVKVLEKGVRQKLVSSQTCVADHLIVRFEPGGTQKDIEKALKHLKGWSIRKRLASGSVLVAFPAGDTKNFDKYLAALNNAEGIRTAEPDNVVYALNTPNDPRYNELWAMNNTGQTGGTADADIDAPEAWDIHTGNKLVRVGVVDTGIDYTHTDLAANIWTNAGEIPANGIDDDGNGYIDDIHGWDFCNDDSNPMDDNSHGTHCSGTIAGVGNNGIGVAGVNWTADLVALKFLDASGSGYDSDAADAIRYATDNGCKITSNSWGGPGYADELLAAVEYANANGCLLAAAAGNDALNNDTSSNRSYPASFTTANVVAVAATDSTDSLAYYSNYGHTSVDLGAPGSEILSTIPKNKYDTYSGTSMATPHTAGVLALMWSRAPGMPAADIKQRLLDATDPLASLTNKCVSGGRLNAYNAVLGMPLTYLHLAGYQTSDSTGGNGDGIINPGEQINISVTLGNNCPVTAQNVTAVLSISPADLSVTVINGTSNFGTIPPGTEATGQTDFVIQIQPSAVTPHIFNCLLAVSAQDSGTINHNFSLGIYKTCILSGSATNDGAGIAGISIASKGGPVERAAVSAADGNYSLSLAEGTQQIICTAPGRPKFICAQTASVNLTSSTVMNFAFVSAYVTGHVSNSDTNESVAGATILWSGDVSGTDSTGSAGNYSVRFSVAATRTGTLKFKARLDGVLLESPPVTVIIPPDTVVDFGLHPPRHTIIDAAQLIKNSWPQIGPTIKKLGIYDINGQGEMVGWAWTEKDTQDPNFKDYVYHFDGEVTRTVEYPDPNANLDLGGINDDGWITGKVGWPSKPELWWFGTIRSPSGTYTILPKLSVEAQFISAETWWINKNRNVIGQCWAGWFTYYPCYWHDGIVEQLDDTGSNAYAESINDLDQITLQIGDYAALWQNGTRSYLPWSQEFPQTYAYSAHDINNEGFAVGEQYYYYTDLTGYTTYYAQPMKWNIKTGQMTKLDPLPRDDGLGPYGAAFGICDKGQIVGCDMSPLSTSTDRYHAVMWDSGSVLDLNSLILSTSGWELDEAWVIDEFGEIFGIGTKDGKSNQYFLLVPNHMPPRAIITAAPSTGVPPLTVSFNSAGSMDKDGTIVSYAWNFGDGATGSGAAVSHQYISAGIYGAVLTVTDNEGMAASCTATITVQAPDLVMTTGTATLTAANKLAIDAKITSSGSLNAPAGFDAGAWLSSDSVLDGSDIELWSVVRSTPLNVGSSWSLSSTITGSNITPGAWHVLIAADSGNIIQEELETNNIIDVPMELRPNLFVSSASWTVSGGNVGGTFKIKNDGFAKLPGSARAGLYLSADDNVTNTDYLCGTYTTTSAGLDYAEMDTKTISFAIPGNVPAGTYTLGIIADDNGQVIESDETDNVKIRGTPVTVTGGTLPGQANNPSPADGAGGVGLDADLSWTAGSGATSHDVYFGTTNSPPLAASNITATSYQLPTLSISAVYYWRITEKNSAGSTAGALWSFTAVSGKASNPSPSNGANNVDAVSADLSWTAGIGATSHDVYFGTTSSPLFIGNQTSTVYDLNNSGYNWTDLENMAGHWLISCPPADCGGADLNVDGIVDLLDFTVLAQHWMIAGPALEAGKSYYWRIDEHNSGGTVTGDLWSFATAGGTPECLVSHWKLDETSGTTAADSTGNEHTGTLIEGTAGSLVWSAGHIGGALSFDGDGPSNNVNSFCRVAVPTAGMSVSSGTVALWAKIAATGPNNYSARNNGIYLFGAKGGTTNDRILISTIATDLGLDIGIGSTTANNVVTLTRSSWYHIALTWDSNVYTLYVNGQSVKTGSFGSLSVLTAADIGNRGESTYNQSMHGLMDDVRIYSCALTAEAIAALAGQ